MAANESYHNKERKNKIIIKGAHIHNLKKVNATIPRGKLTVITGVSSSGKSSLAFDTLYQERKRRYLMFSDTQYGIDSVPTFDSITGLSPTVAVEQRIIRQSNPRSTVGTRTKLSAILAILFANYGVRNSKYDDGLPLSMEMFQRNSARGICAKCLGKGQIREVFEDEIYGDKTRKRKELLEGKFMSISSWHHKLNDYLRVFRLTENTRLQDLSEEQFFALKYGSPKTKFEGVNFFAPGIEATEEGGSKSIFSPSKIIFIFQSICKSNRMSKMQGNRAWYTGSSHDNSR